MQHRPVSVVVAGEAVVVDSGTWSRVDVDGGAVEAWDLVMQLVSGGVGDGVSGDDDAGVVDGDGGFGVHPVPDPPQPNLVHADDSKRGGQGGFGLVDQAWVDGVHETPVDVSGGSAQHEEDGHGDQEPDDRVG